MVDVAVFRRIVAYAIRRSGGRAGPGPYRGVEAAVLSHANAAGRAGAPRHGVLPSRGSVRALGQERLNGPCDSWSAERSASLRLVATAQLGAGPQRRRGRQMKRAYRCRICTQTTILRRRQAEKAEFLTSGPCESPQHCSSHSCDLGHQGGQLLVAVQAALGARDRRLNQAGRNEYANAVDIAATADHDRELLRGNIAKYKHGHAATLGGRAS
jgi:hypothetical protein